MSKQGPSRRKRTLRNCDSRDSDWLWRSLPLDRFSAKAKMVTLGLLSIDLVRGDLYSNDSRIRFGEMPLTLTGRIFHRWTQKVLNDMGEMY